MATPLTLETPVGYVSSEDLYISYREYYGDGTIYGRVDLLTPEGEPVKGAGKTKLDLINANVVLGENVIGSIGGDLVAVPNEAVPEETVAAECCSGCPCAAPAAAPVAEEVVTPAAEAPAECSCPCDAPAVEEVVSVARTCCCGCPCGEVPIPADCCSNCCCNAGDANCCGNCPCKTSSVAETVAVAPVKEEPVNDRYTVSLSIFGFAVNREFTVKIDNATRNIYLS